MIKRIPAILLVTVLLFGVLSFTGCGKNENEENGLVFALNDDGVSYSVVEYKASAAELTVPSTFKGLPVTEIKNAAIYGNPGLRKLTVSENIKVIGLSAVRANDYLEEIVLPTSLEEIKSEAFADCRSLKNITVAEGGSVYSSEGGVLFANNMTELMLYPAKLEPSADEGQPRVYTLPEGVTKIGNGAFRGCQRVDEVVLPESLTEIGEYAFCNFTTLTCIDLKNVQTVGKYAFYSCTSLDDIVIPDSVLTVGEYAFANCIEAGRVIIGDGLTEIAPYTFSSCRAVVTINSGINVKTIGEGAFSGNTSAVRVLFSDLLESVKEKAFSSCTSLMYVYYLGTQEQYLAIEVDKSNTQLKTVAVNFEYKMPDKSESS